MSDPDPRSLVRVPAALMMTLLLGGSVARLDASTMREALLDSLPKYDPVIRQEALAREEAEAAHRDAEGSARLPPPRVPGKNAEAPKDTIELPEVVVEAPREKARPLPRVHETPPVKKVEIEPFATPAERDAQLVKRHLTPLDRKVLNRFALPLVGKSRETRAREAESIAQNARQLNRMADMIEFMEREGADPEEIEKFKKLYLEMVLARPK